MTGIYLFVIYFNLLLLNWINRKGQEMIHVTHSRTVGFVKVKLGHILSSYHILKVCILITVPKTSGKKNCMII